jgi:BMFP domain-containing protein YqiC
MTGKKAQNWRGALPKRISELQRTVEKQLRKNWDRATEMLPPAPRKAVKRLTANADRVRSQFRKRGDRLVAEARKRADRLSTDVQKRIEEAVTPLTSRLDVASRAEVDRLRKRVHELERRLESHGEPAHAA